WAAFIGALRPSTQGSISAPAGSHEILPPPPIGRPDVLGLLSPALVPKNVLPPGSCIDLSPFTMLMFSTVSMLAVLIVASLFRVGLTLHTASPGAVMMRLTVSRFARCRIA